MAADSEPVAGSQSVLAPAKVNLFLHVVGRRGDGYHLLESLVVFTSVGDRLSIEPSADLTLTVTGRFAEKIGGPAEDNLVLKAASALRQSTGATVGARIVLEKNLPVAAGIGGGSADAAAALLALNSHWGTDLSPDTLAELALPLGADIPACLHRSAVMMRGIGEDLTPVEVPRGIGIILANPMTPLPTPAVFADFRSYEPFADSGQADWGGFASPESWFERLKSTSNSLEPPALRLLPRVGTVIGALSGLDGCRLARMSGSGATCFGLFDNWRTAARMAARLSSENPDWWVAPGHILT